MGNEWWIKIIMPPKSNLASQYTYWADLKAWVNSKAATSLQSPLHPKWSLGKAGASCSTCRQLSWSEPLPSAATNTVDIISGRGLMIIIRHSPWAIQFLQTPNRRIKGGWSGNQHLHISQFLSSRRNHLRDMLLALFHYFTWSGKLQWPPFAFFSHNSPYSTGVSVEIPATLKAIYPNYVFWD